VRNLILLDPSALDQVHGGQIDPFFGGRRDDWARPFVEDGARRALDWAKSLLPRASPASKDPRAIPGDGHAPGERPVYPAQGR